MAEDWLTAKEVASILKMGASTFSKYRKRHPRFPQPVSIGTTEKGQSMWRWRRSEVEAFLVITAANQRSKKEAE